MNVTFRPIGEWPREETDPRLPSPYSIGHEETLGELRREVARLGAEHLVVQVSVLSGRIRSDGLLRRDAKPVDPRVIVGFQHHEQGWISYPADLYDDWEGNLRAITLTLQDLRRAGQRGVLQQGEQYVGSRLELEAGRPRLEERTDDAREADMQTLSTRPIRTLEDAEALLIEYGHVEGETDLLLLNPASYEKLYRRAARKLHPDAGGPPGAFENLQRARDLLIGGEQ